MDVSSYLVGAAVVSYVIARQFAGRWVPARRSLLLPLVLVVVGVGWACRCSRSPCACSSRCRSWTPALEATLAASFGVSLAVQLAVFNARVARDGRPIRPARRRAETRATLVR